MSVDGTWEEGFSNQRPRARPSLKLHAVAIFFHCSVIYLLDMDRMFHRIIF